MVRRGEEMFTRDPIAVTAIRPPNFFVVGTPKAGTTALYHYLAQHPGIYMSPIKEPAYFAADLFAIKQQLGIAEPDPDALRAYLDGPLTGPGTGVVADWDQYLKLFKNVQDETAIGEVSGNYLASSAAPRAIRERVPHARIVMILRDPVDRLFSQYSEAVGEGEASLGFLHWVDEQAALESARTPRLGAVWNGFYARHLQRYLEHFPSEQVQVCFYEDYCRSPRAMLRGMFAFLGVDPDFTPDLSRGYNVTWQPRSASLQDATAPLRNMLRGVAPAAVKRGWRTVAHRRPRRLGHDERNRVLVIYAEDIRELQQLVGRDLSAWLH
jgi:hypothetical protein